MTSGRNRITELEGTVDELKSTVRGLTEELVEANQRIRDLESAVEEQATDEGAREAAKSQASVEEAKSAESQGSDTETGESERKIDDDIIVA